MKPTTRNVLDRLRVAPATTHDLCQPEVGGIRFGGRIKELRYLGYVIDRKRVREGSHLYTLIAEPETSPSTSSSPVNPPAGASANGAQRDSATAHETADMPAPSDSPLVARAETSRIPTTEGNAVLTTVEASAQARGSDSTGTDRCREQNGTFEAVRRPEPLTGPCLADKSTTDRAIVPATSAVPASGSRTDAAPSYGEFLRSKATIAPATGFHVDVDQISDVLKPHQRKIVQWAVAGGRRALFESFGLGKTIQQLEILRLILDHGPLNGRGLIVCPLGVHQEFEHDARLLGIEDRLHRVKTTEQAQQLPAGSIALTNYEPVRDGKLDPNVFTVASLDEAAILRSFGSKTYQGFLTLFEQVPYRFVATATPSPNRYKELIHYGAFLGIMDSGQALTRFFKRDSTQANNLTLLETQERNFWLWLASWSVWLQEPSELCDCACHAAAVNGSCPHCECAAYQLPQLDIQQHRLEVDHLAETNLDSWGQTILLRDSARSIQEAAKEKRRTLPLRLARMVEIINEFQGEGSADTRRDRGQATGATRVREALEASEPGAGASLESEALRAQPRGVQGEEPTVARGESGTRSRVGAGAPSQERRDVQDTVARLVSGESGTSSSDDAPEQTQARVRVDAGAVRGDADGAGWPLPDLRHADDTARRGSLPYNGEGARTSLSRVQRSARNLEGRSGDPDESGQVSDQLIIWCDLNDEQRAIERCLNDLGLTYSSIDGSLSTEEVERRLAEWRGGRTYALVGKPQMLGVGMNLQQCNKAIFLGITHKFHQTIQACHRIHRFGQQHPCRVDLIFAESEQHIADNLLAKWSQHVELTGTMRDLLSEHGLSGLSIETALTRSLGVDRDEASGDGWRLVRNDCIPETESMEENSVGLIVTSIPFNTQYEYSAATEDLGFNDDVAAFWEQMDYLTPQLLRVLQPGRLYCCHVKDRILFGNVTGAGLPTVLPFHAQAIDHGMRHGFDYLGMVTIVTDVVRENNQTYRLGWSENAKDGTKMGVGSPEYVLLFHKPQTDRSRGYADVPVLHPKDEYTRARWQVDAHAFWRSSGNRLLSVDELAAMGPDVLASEFTRQSVQQVYDYEDHVRIGEALEARGKLPSSFMSLAPGSNDPMVWHDVNRMLTLNGEQKARNLTLHICPLQIDIVDRLIRRFSNEGDVVFDPFAGLGTVPLQALKMGRQGIGVELNSDYWRDSVGYLKAEEAKRDVPTLFDMLDAQAVAA